MFLLMSAPPPAAEETRASVRDRPGILFLTIDEIAGWAGARAGAGWREQAIARDACSRRPRCAAARRGHRLGAGACCPPAPSAAKETQPECAGPLADPLPHD